MEATIYRPLAPVSFDSEELKQISDSIERKRGSFMQRRSMNRNLLIKANTSGNIKLGSVTSVQ